MQKITFILTAVLLCAAATATAADTGLTQDQIEAIAIQPANGKVQEAMLKLFSEESIKYTGKSKYKDATIKYRLHRPSNIEVGKKYPLVLWLHGAGENGNDNQKNLIHLHHILPYLTGEKERDFYLLVPQAPKDSGWGTLGGTYTQNVGLQQIISPRTNQIRIPVNSQQLPWYQQLFFRTGDHNVQAVIGPANKSRWVEQNHGFGGVNGKNREEKTRIFLDDNGKPSKLEIITTITKNDGSKEKTEVKAEGEENVRKQYRASRIELYVRQFKEEMYSGREMEVTAEDTDDPDTVNIHYGTAFEDCPLAYSFAIIDELLKKEAVDADKITVSGLSSGGDGTWEALELRPNLFAAGVPIVSWRTWDDKVLEKTPLLKKVPVWAIYSSDDRSIDHARDNFERAEKAGCNVKKTEFGVCGHNGWTPAMLQADTFSFLLSRGKKGEEFVQVADPKVKPEEMRGIVEVVRNGGKPKLAPPNEGPAAASAVPVVENDELKIEVRTSDGEKVIGKMIEDCDRPWAMTSDSQYGLFAADWMKEGKDLPQFVIELPSDDLAKRFAKSAAADGTDIAETCRAVLNLEHGPMSNPLFETAGGRLQSNIKYTLSDKGKMFVRFLKTLKESNDDKNQLKSLSEKTLKRIDSIVE